MWRARIRGWGVTLVPGGFTHTAAPVPGSW